MRFPSGWFFWKCPAMWRQYHCCLSNVATSREHAAPNGKFKSRLVGGCRDGEVWRRKKEHRAGSGGSQARPKHQSRLDFFACGHATTAVVLGLYMRNNCG